MKKILCLLLCALLALSFVACGGKGNETATKPQGTDAPTTDAPTKEATDAKTEETVDTGNEDNDIKVPIEDLFGK